LNSWPLYSLRHLCDFLDFFDYHQTPISCMRSNRRGVL
jgi:hypothetical protein